MPPCIRREKYSLQNWSVDQHHRHLLLQQYHHHRYLHYSKLHHLTIIKMTRVLPPCMSRGGCSLQSWSWGEDGWFWLAASPTRGGLAPRSSPSWGKQNLKYGPYSTTEVTKFQKDVWPASPIRGGQAPRSSPSWRKQIRTTSRNTALTRSEFELWPIYSSTEVTKFQKEVWPGRTGFLFRTILGKFSRSIPRCRHGQGCGGDDSLTAP